MSENAIFEGQVQDAADKILALVNAEGPLSSWQVKTRLHLSSSLMYLALGRLQARSQVRLEPDQLNYQVKPAQD